MSTVYFVFPFTALFGCLVLLARSRRLKDYSEALEEYGFRLAFLAPFGLFLAGKIALRFSPTYDRKIRANIERLYGKRNSAVFLLVHRAQQVALVAMVGYCFGMVALLGEVDGTFYVLGLVIAGLVVYWLDRDLEQKVELRKRSILMDLPSFLNTLALLVNAGLPFSSAVQKVVGDSDHSRPLYREIGFLLGEIHGGKSTSQAYEDLAQRCRVPEITRFVTALLQNLHKGNKDLVFTLRMLGHECWQRRKDIARKQGEEASAKLVFPMVMVFVAVSLIVLAPAVITMGK